MDWATATAWALGFGLGLVHAFDADHVMAVSVYASREPKSRRSAIGPGLRWALGHGLMILLVGGGLVLLGRALPPGWDLWAERGVALFMIGLGLMVLREIATQRGHLHFHTHGDLLPHAHWHSHASSIPESIPESFPEAGHQHDHAPLFVGGLHGLAGSAPVLAVLPAATQAPALGLLYLVFFTVGVAAAMCLVSGLLGALAGRLAASQKSFRGLDGLRGGTAIGSIGVGLWMLATAG